MFAIRKLLRHKRFERLFGALFCAVLAAVIVVYAVYVNAAVAVLAAVISVCALAVIRDDRNHYRSFVRVTHDDDRVDPAHLGDQPLTAADWYDLTADCARCHHPRCTGRPVYYVSHADDHHHYCRDHTPRLHRP